MGFIPHSGNLCSGLCEPPCRHEGCWQCEQYDATVKAKPAPMSLSQTTASIRKFAEQAKADEREAAMEKLRTMRPGSILAAAPAQKQRDHQKATVTRIELEGLAERAGVKMNWNDGQPTFFGEDFNARQKQLAAGEQKLRDEALAKLKEGSSVNLSRQAAASLAAAAAATMDKMTSDVIRKAANDVLREDILANEERVKEKFRKEGASEDDIAAAEKLFGWRPDQDTEDEFLDVLDRELAAVSGLKDLLTDNRLLPVTSGQSGPMTLGEMKEVIASMGKRFDITPPSKSFSDSVSDMVQKKIEATLRAPLPHLQPKNFGDKL